MTTHYLTAALLVVATQVVGAGLTLAVAAPTFDAPDAQYQGRVWANPVTGGPTLPGSVLDVGGDGFKPGQRVIFSRGIEPLMDEALTADKAGRIEARYTVPADAVPGIHPIVLTTLGPYHAEVLPLKISRAVALVPNRDLAMTQAALVPGLYQVGYAPNRHALYVTAATGYPPREASVLLEVDPDTLAIRRQAPVATLPGDAGAAGAYGLGIDEKNGNLWVTNTRQDAIAVYALADLSLRRQFETGSAIHARDVVIDAQRDRVYVSQVTKPEIAVFDARTLAPLPAIALPIEGRGKPFSPASLRLDPASGRLYTVNLNQPEVAEIDGPAGKVVRRIAVPGADSAIGVDVAPDVRRLFVAAQGTDNLVILDLDSGKVLHDVPVGAGALNVAYEPARRLAYVVSRGAGTVTAVDADGRIVANLGGVGKANDLVADAKGRVYVVDKSGGPKDADKISRLQWAPTR